MSAPLCVTTPCRRCDQPHPSRIANDGMRTYAAPDGHAWVPSDSAAPTPEAERHAMFEADAFGLAYVCTVCNDGVLRSGRPHHLATHREWHDGMETA